MPRKDFYHDTVKRALEKDGWQITHDPLVLKFEEITLFADLGAERIFQAQNAGNSIVVEIKVFGKKVLMSDFERAVGQYELYRIFLGGIGIKSQVFMAVSEISYDNFFRQKAIQRAVEKLKINLLVFEHKTERITQWTNWQNIEK